MKKITVCVGSSCHLKGAPEIVERLKELVEESGIESEIEFSASFCFGRCTEGVVVKFDDEIMTNVSPDNIEEIFYFQLKGGE
ncbi:(2Fe-2S) ferredoxin domain-containing protein [Sporohalobacter salinus]|uniref:(2Fe-2S) ferredoxin domain-containing protein n=1 Tax=Sporohalobacter salinus TaxID=1494606 RepID=UPI001960BBDD|nr:NAD(P)H-dependent oxidoreductase subunit E [Sporohalobacter salinus]MBM7624570.1 NADH:ubiquinone oxidoreductase subunit E [Sporohalobacter salinus]